MTYIAILRSAEASERDLAPLERRILARIAQECPAAKWVASGGGWRRPKCLDLFEVTDEATAARIVSIARSPGLTETARCSAIPWKLFAEDEDRGVDTARIKEPQVEGNVDDAEAGRAA